MFDNALNRDTVFYFGLNDAGWQSTKHICNKMNANGFAITIDQTTTLLNTMTREGRVVFSYCGSDDGSYIEIWRKVQQGKE